MQHNIGKKFSNVLRDEFSEVTLEGTLPHPIQGTLDDWIVKGARVSYRGQAGDPEKDAGLINYLISHQHDSPMEQPHITFSIRAPMAVIVHLLRHRTFHVNGESSRFKEPKEEYYFPSEWRKQDLKNKQGSGGTVNGDVDAFMDTRLREVVDYSIAAYKTAIENGVAREQARLLLPTDANYRSYVITSDLRNLMNMIYLRSQNDAQWETRQYACAMYWLLEPQMPIYSRIWMEKVAKPESAKNLTAWKEFHGEPTNA